MRKSEHISNVQHVHIYISGFTLFASTYCLIDLFNFQSKTPVFPDRSLQNEANFLITLSIVSGSQDVTDEGLKRGCYEVRFFFAHRYDERNFYYRLYGRFALIADSEQLTDLPEYSSNLTSHFYWFIFVSFYLVTTKTFFFVILFYTSRVYHFLFSQLRHQVNSIGLLNVSNII